MTKMLGAGGSEDNSFSEDANHLTTLLGGEHGSRERLRGLGGELGDHLRVVFGDRSAHNGVLNIGN